MAFSIDLLGEACVSDSEALAYQERYLSLVRELPALIDSWPRQELLEADHLGEIPRANISIKISSLSARINPADFDRSVSLLRESLSPILLEAGRRNVFVNFDMEQYSLKDMTLELFQQCCEQFDFPAGIALQAYLRGGPDDADRLIAWAKRTDRQVTVRLIKGAYWDYETIHAEQMGWPVPVWSRKTDTDACFEQMTEQLIKAIPRSEGQGGIKLAIGSHNVRSIAHAQALLPRHELPPNALEFQLLEGMADHLKLALVEASYRVRSYAPIGELIPGMAYLVRRLLENTSNESWLRGSAHDVSDDRLLAAPSFGSLDDDPGLISVRQSAERHRLSPCAADLGEGRPFRNEPLRDFSDKVQRDRFAQSIARSRPARVRGEATVHEAEQAIAAAEASFPAWANRSAAERAEMLIRAAAWLRERRDQLSGEIIREAGKTWREADADVCEAIDFCEYYARCAVTLFEEKRLGRFVGELNTQLFRPLGVVAVISPWNFPLAICAGMTVAALVTGNTVIVKPSRQTPGAAQRLCEALWRAGVPSGALQFLPGPGSTVGAKLVEHPRVALIGFTGSREVGFSILESAGKMRTGQAQPKRVVCEMGGKNAIIVDSTADLDEAVLAVRHSAFSYAGQKCSACSRVIIVDDAYSTFLPRLIESTKTLRIGDPLEPGTDVGPVIDESAARRILSSIDTAKRENRLELAVSVPDGLAQLVGKPFVGPHIFTEVRPDDTIAVEEIFGPVLAILRAKDFEAAIQIANVSPYKLTGGVFSRTPRNLQIARTQLHVGNLYLNRGITGALVARQPFGGFGHSGLGTKAGGAEYLQHFAVPVVCSENTMRRGFSPELDG
jgi:RHH-type proline utilization regulon transcriptional repressor/proline dehydrogenase/delta 1-pyrroline-5-carboxylate dehydrogenase